MRARDRVRAVGVWGKRGGDVEKLFLRQTDEEDLVSAPRSSDPALVGGFATVLGGPEGHTAIPEGPRGVAPGRRSHDPSLDSSEATSCGRLYPLI